MDVRQIVAGNPELSRFRQRVKVLSGVPPLLTIAAVTAFLTHLPIAGWILAALAVFAAAQIVRMLLQLGDRVRAIEKGETGARQSVPAKFTAPFFAGFLGKMAFVCFAIAAIAAVLAVAQFSGSFKTTEGIWLGPFFVVLWSIVGLTLGGIGRSFATAQLRERTLREKGVAGSARILHCNKTGATIKDAPQVKCEIEVALPGRTPYRATIFSAVPIAKVSLLTAKEPVRVLVDPNDPHEILIDW